MRDFDPTYERSGSVSRLLAEATPPFMSAMPPIATKAMSRSETSLCARSRRGPFSAYATVMLDRVPDQATPLLAAVGRRLCRRRRCVTIAFRPWALKRDGPPSAVASASRFGTSG
jgi:hypothetical protein